MTIEGVIAKRLYYKIARNIDAGIIAIFTGVRIDAQFMGECVSPSETGIVDGEIRFLDDEDESSSDRLS